MKAVLLVILGTTWIFLAPAAEQVAKPTTDEIMGAELDRAERAFRRRAYGDAISAASGVLQADPKNARAYLLRGQVYEETRQHEKAIADFDAVLKQEPRAAVVFQHRGFERFRLG